MAGARIKVRIDDDAVRAALARLEDRARDLGPALEAIGEHLLLSHEERFELEETPEGEPWIPLHPDYHRRKPKNVDRILTLEGELRGTLRYQVRDGELLFGSDRVYAATHPFGREDNGIVARPFLGVSDEDRAEIRDILIEHLAEE